MPQVCNELSQKFNSNRSKVNDFSLKLETIDDIDIQFEYVKSIFSVATLHDFHKVVKL